ncbi:MAG: VF530 family protein [Kiritimatiellaceae bacterium]|nr:VF530 family protein [Kiritimatiellaceae bacterium]
MSEQPNNPLHGITLEKLLIQLVDHYGWDELGRQIDIRCFNWEPSVKSSLKFLRKTQWARDKVETLYLCTDFTEG